MADKVFNIIIKLIKQGGADAETVKGLVDIKNAMTEGMAVAGTLTAAYFAVDNVLKQTVGKLVTYAGEVKNLQAITGDTADDTSRLLTITNDYGVTVADLTMAQKTLAKTGESLSTVTLARMSDEFLKLGTGAEKTRYLIDNFGRSGADLATFLSQGSEALLKMADGVQKNLVLDDQMITEAQKLKLQQAQLNDEWNATEIGIGRKMVPSLISLIDYSNRYNETISKQRTSWMQYVPILSAGYSLYNQIAMLFQRNPPETDQPMPGVSNSELEKWNGLLDRSNTELDKWNGLLASSKRGDEMWQKQQADEVTRLKAVQDAAEALNQALADERGWESMYTGAKDAESRTKAAVDLMSKDLQSLGQGAGGIWEAFMEATGQISKPAIEEFVKIQTAFLVAQRMLREGMKIDVVVDYLISVSEGGGVGGGGGGGGGKSKYSALHQAWMDYWNGKGPKPSQPDPGYAYGADFTVPAGYPNDSYMMRVQSGEHVTVTPAGATYNYNYGGSGNMQDMLKAIKALPEKIGTELDKRIK